MRLQSVTLHQICLQLKTPFVTSNGAYTDRETIIVEALAEDGTVGWGECVAFATPWYTEETVDTAWLMLEQYLIPAILAAEINHPEDVQSLFESVRRHHMAKAGLEMAIWDIYSKQMEQPLAEVIGGIREQISVGVAVGLQASDTELYRVIEQYITDGYERIKVKIKPGQDIELLRGIRKHFPALPLMADANSAYELSDIDHLKRLDKFELMMIEQPLGVDDIVEHAKLQREINTPICLDESIISYDNVQNAIELESCQIINIKLGRIGGYSEALKIHELCKQHQIPLWSGGMLESGIGRAHNIALASLSQYILPGDISASARYWDRDIIVPEVTIQAGKVQVSKEKGIGYEVDREFMSTITSRKVRFGRKS